MKRFLQFVLFIFLAALGLAGCGGSDNPATTTNAAPRVVNLQMNPTVVCVGGGSQVTFAVQDDGASPDQWTSQLSTTLHGTMSPPSGTATPGSSISINFKAAKSGRHQHRVVLTITASDSSGLQSEPATLDFYVFNCG